MVDYRPEEFKIGYGGSDGDNTETAMREEMVEQRVEKLGHRITLISILLPVLILVIFAVAYMDIKKRVYSMQDSGVEDVARLSEELESKFSKLSVQFAALDSELSKREQSLKKLEDSFTRKIASMDEIFLSMETTTNTLKGANQELLENNQALEKKIGELEAKLSGVDKQIGDAAAENAAAIEAVRQDVFDKQELSSQFAVIDESFKVVQGDMQTLSSNIDLIDKNFKSELETLAKIVVEEKDRLSQAVQATEELTKVVGEFRQEFNSFSLDTENFVKDSDLPLQIEKARLKLKVAVDEAVREMTARMDRLEKKIEAASGRASSPPVKPGQVIEQNLQ